MTVSYAIVVPTLGRSSLRRLIESLDVALSTAPVLPFQVVLVHDTAAGGGPLDLGAPSQRLASRLAAIPGEGRGPAAARNAGWAAAVAPTAPDWIAFLDDDVLVPAAWATALVADLSQLPEDVGGSQGRVRVPLPADRPPTDWERNVAGLERAAWATADMAYRRTALEAVGGFDTRFSRAYREDADLALRVEAAGWKLVRGGRMVDHPVRPADRWVSVRLQRGNADDVLMSALHGRDWRRRASAPPGRRRRHAAVTAAGLAALGGWARGRPRLALAAAAGWAAGTAELASARIAPGPRSRHEVLTMVATSAAIPPAAVAWYVAGLVRWRRLLLPGTGGGASAAGSSTAGSADQGRRERGAP